MCPFIAQPLPHTPPPPSATSTPSLVVPVMTPKFAFETFEYFLPSAWLNIDEFS